MDAVNAQECVNQHGLTPPSFCCLIPFRPSFRDVHHNFLKYHEIRHGYEIFGVHLRQSMNG